MVRKIPPRELAPVAATGTDAVHKKADILIAIGATGSGKSTRVKRDIQARKIKRVMVWDWMREYTDIQAAPTMAALQKIVLSGGDFEVRFLPSYTEGLRREQFSQFCNLAMYARRVAILAEELSKVVDANGGNPGWERVITEGRHRELVVYGTSQRPALVDKTSLSQATRLYVGNLELPADVKVMATILGVDHAEIAALGPWDFIERHRETKQLHRGNLAKGHPKGGYVA